MPIEIQLLELYETVRDYCDKFELRTLNGYVPQGITAYSQQNPLTVVFGTALIGVVVGILGFGFVHFFFLGGASSQAETVVDDEEEEDNEICTDIPAPLRGDFNSKVFESLRREGISTSSEECNEECEFLIKRETIEFASEPEKQAEKSTQPKKKKNNVTFDKTVLSHSNDKDLGDLSKLANENVLGTIGELHGKLKTAEIRAKSKLLEKEMSAQQRAEEAAIRAQQMEAIYALMQADEAKFGISDRQQMDEQMQLYAL